MKRKKADATADQDPLIPLFDVARRLVKKLEGDARKLGELGEEEIFPERRARELREKIVEGFFDWAIRRMGADIETYLEEGRQNFLDHFILNHAHFDPKGRMPREYERFWEPFEKTRFFIPLKPGRRIVHHSRWGQAYEIYRDTLPVLQEIKRKTRANKKSCLLAIKEQLPGVPDDEAERIWRAQKPSDGAAEYARWKLGLAVGGEALKEYFKVFHDQYGYFDFLARNLLETK
jgi:hypothetical protein